MTDSRDLGKFYAEGTRRPEIFLLCDWYEVVDEVIDCDCAREPWQLKDLPPQFLVSPGPARDQPQATKFGSCGPRAPICAQQPREPWAAKSARERLSAASPNCRRSLSFLFKTSKISRQLVALRYKDFPSLINLLYALLFFNLFSGQLLAIS